MCGSCHDIQNLQGAHVERTFEEWQGTLFAALPNGQGCADCHMKSSDGPASTVSTKVRRLHAHGFPAVDLAVTEFPERETQKMRSQQLLDDVIQPTLCLDTLTNRLELTLENVDRRPQLAERRHARSPRLGRADRLRGRRRHLFERR